MTVQALTPTASALSRANTGEGISTSPAAVGEVVRSAGEGIFTSPAAVGEVARRAGEGIFTSPAAVGEVVRSAGEGSLDRRLCVAPMMDYTDRHCRYLLRLLSPHALLYTEMVTAQAVAHGDIERLLGFDPAEHPVALQLGGSDPKLLADAARIGERRGYDEINLNVGCPSDRVQSGRFGACLMAEPELVADCMRAMREAVKVPVTVKCRIGIDDRDDYAFFERFVSVVREAGVKVFIVHARKAHLQGLSPKENREVPPLRYDVPARLKREHPELSVVLNGGIRTAAQVDEWLPRVDGVMLGRQAYQEPYLLAELDARIFGAARATAPARGRGLRICRLRRTHARGGAPAAGDVASCARAVRWPSERAFVASIPWRKRPSARSRGRRAARIAQDVRTGRLTIPPLPLAGEVAQSAGEGSEDSLTPRIGAVTPTLAPSPASGRGHFTSPACGRGRASAGEGSYLSRLRERSPTGRVRVLETLAPALSCKRERG